MFVPSPWGLVTLEAACAPLSWQVALFVKAAGIPGDPFLDSEKGPSQPRAEAAF